MKAEIDDESVARYLQDNPEFFARNAELLSQLHFPNPHGDKAISITERQMVALRDKVRHLEGKLAELINFGEENDAIGEKVHRLGLALLAAENLAAALSVLYEHLGEAFIVPHVTLRLWSTQKRNDSIEFAPVGEAVRDLVASLPQPYCAPAAAQEVIAWFGEGGHHVRSLALIPLRRDADTVGALVLASEEAQRFYPDMGTLYLTHIGELAAAALLRTLA